MDHESQPLLLQPRMSSGDLNSLRLELGAHSLLPPSVMVDADKKFGTFLGVYVPCKAAMRPPHLTTRHQFGFRCHFIYSSGIYHWTGGYVAVAVRVAAGVRVGVVDVAVGFCHFHEWDDQSWRRLLHDISIVLGGIRRSVWNDFLSGERVWLRVLHHWIRGVVDVGIWSAERSVGNVFAGT